MIKETYAMTAPKSLDPAGFLREQLASASPDLLREMVKTFADALMSAEADDGCAAPPTANAARSAPTPATATDAATGTPERARWSWRFRSYAPARTFRIGC